MDHKNGMETASIKPASSCPPQTNTVPDWVNSETFEEIVRADLPEFEEIIKFTALPALAPGENYATFMLRITIDVQLKDRNIKKLSYMMKVPHHVEDLNEMHEIFFQNENMLLGTFLPELEQLYRDVGVHVRFGPNAHKLSKDVGNYILMDDLGSDGFKNANRIECLDLAHSELVLEKLARYHAASAVRFAEKGAYPKRFVDMEVAKLMWTAMITSFGNNFLNNLENFENGERYRKAMEHFFNNVDNEIDKVMKHNSDIFNVLTHGDCWSNNILFKYDENGHPTDVIFVDFQMPRWATPMQDLLFFIISSIRMEIKLSKFNYFLRFYYDHLIANMKLLKYPKQIPTLTDLHVQVFETGSWGVITALIILPIVVLEPTENAKVENFISSDEEGVLFRDSVYKNERFVQYVNELLPWFYDRGIINAE